MSERGRRGKSKRISVPARQDPGFPRSFPGAAAAGQHFPPPKPQFSQARRGGHGQQGQARRHRHRADSTRESIRRPFHQQSRPMESDVPGFYWDESRGKYFSIPQGPCPAANGYTLPELRAEAVERERREAVTRPFGAGKPAPSSSTATRAILNRDRGTERRPLRRVLRESRLWGLGAVEPRPFQVASRAQVEGCAFLDVDREARSLVSVWNNKGRAGQRLLTHRMSLDGGGAGEREWGLRLSEEGELSALSETVVDACVAPVDAAVTCLLYVAMPTAPNEPFHVGMGPVPLLTSVDDDDILDSPVYNIDWYYRTDVSACAWNSSKMRLGLGMGEGYGLIVDVVSERDFRLSAKRRPVWAQEFSKSGELVFMGLRGAATIACDLRLPSHHTVYELGQDSVHHLQLLNRNPDLLIAASLKGSLNLWDLRQTSRPVLEYPAHVNTHSRISVALDEEERLLFGVGSDGVSRGWALDSGHLLAAFPSPLPAARGLPRIAFRNSWAATPGASALLLAQGTAMYAYQLKA